MRALKATGRALQGVTGSSGELQGVTESYREL